MPVRPWVALARLALLASAIVVAALLVPRPELSAARSLIDSAGAAAPGLYVLCYIAGAVLLVPRPLLSVAGGLLFGPLLGTALAVVGATVAALACFGLARGCGRGLPRRSGGVRALQRVDAMLQRRGWLAVFYLRLLPVVPYSAVNYGCGVSSVRTTHFALGTVLGCIPPTAIAVFAGTAALS